MALPGQHEFWDHRSAHKHFTEEPQIQKSWGLASNQTTVREVAGNVPIGNWWVGGGTPGLIFLITWGPLQYSFFSKINQSSIPSVLFLT